MSRKAPVGMNSLGDPPLEQRTVDHWGLHFFPHHTGPSLTDAPTAVTPAGMRWRHLRDEPSGCTG